MGLRAVLAGVGAGVVAFGVVAALSIESIRTDPVAGIVGVAGGTLAAFATLIGVSLGADRLAPRARLGVETVAAFGYGLLAVGTGVYLGWIDGTTTAVAGAALVAVAFLAARLRP